MAYVTTVEEQCFGEGLLACVRVSAEKMNQSPCRLPIHTTAVYCRVCLWRINYSCEELILKRPGGQRNMQMSFKWTVCVLGEWERGCRLVEQTCNLLSLSLFLIRKLWAISQWFESLFLSEASVWNRFFQKLRCPQDHLHCRALILCLCLSLLSLFLFLSHSPSFLFFHFALSLLYIRNLSLCHSPSSLLSLIYSLFFTLCLFLTLFLLYPSFISFFFLSLYLSMWHALLNLFSSSFSYTYTLSLFLTISLYIHTFALVCPCLLYLYTLSLCLSLNLWISCTLFLSSLAEENTACTLQFEMSRWVSCWTVSVITAC